MVMAIRAWCRIPTVFETYLQVARNHFYHWAPSMVEGLQVRPVRMDEVLCKGYSVPECFHQVE
jgi:hypothetical protein